MGKLVLDKFVKEDLQKIESITSKAVPLEVAEQMVLGTDHAEIGALILAKWSFPMDIVNAVRGTTIRKISKIQKYNQILSMLDEKIICQVSL